MPPVSLNQLGEGTEVKASVSKNLTHITITASLHPDDVETLLGRIEDLIRSECHKTKQAIEVMNQNLEYLNFSLNLD